MNEIIMVFGGLNEIYKILKNAGWSKSRHALDMQKSRKRLSAEVRLILSSHALKNKINLPNNFYNFES